MTTNPADASHNTGDTEQPEDDLKLYWMPHNAKDWLTDPQLSMCSPATRGIWKDAIDVMWLSGQTGQLMGSVTQLARRCRCSESEVKEAIIELFETGAASVLLPSKNGEKPILLSSQQQANLEANLEANGKLILRNRRMYKAHGISKIRAEAGRKGGSKIKAKYRAIHQANSQANGKQSSSKRSVSVSDSEYNYNRVQSQSGSGKEELTISPREAEALDL
jgi:hypothetical protein